MKNWIKLSLTAVFFASFVMAHAQVQVTLDDRDLQYFRRPGKQGINVFETPKDNTVEFNGVTARLGGDFSMIFQGLDHETGLANTQLENLSNNFSLPSANLNIDVQLEDGVRMHLRTYLSSRNHNESWVKGGYIQFDKLDFIKPGLLNGFMEMATIRVGMNDINYGDAHFRRTDNAASIYNPFIENYIMDAFSTEPFMELTLQKNGFLGVAGITNGRLNQAPTSGDNGFVFYGKVGYDKQMNEDLRVRLTGSLYSSSDQGTRDYLYNGDRAGAQYFRLFQVPPAADNNFVGRYNPNYPYLTAVQVNPFIKYGGLEFFGIYEITRNGDTNLNDEGGGTNIGGGFNQVAGELIYRIGANERLYVGARVNKVSGKQYRGLSDQEIMRTNLGAGWFMTDNILTKFEVVNQKYEGDGWTGTVFEDGQFNGFNIQAVISF